MDYIVHGYVPVYGIAHCSSKKEAEEMRAKLIADLQRYASCMTIEPASSDSWGGDVLHEPL